MKTKTINLLSICFMFYVACKPNKQPNSYTEIADQLNLYELFVTKSAESFSEIEDLGYIENKILQLHDSGMSYNYNLQRLWHQKKVNTNDSLSKTLLVKWSSIEVLKLKNEITLLKLWKQKETEDKMLHIAMLEEAINKNMEYEFNATQNTENTEDVEKLVQRKKILEESDSQSIMLFNNSIKFAEEQIILIKNNPLILLEK